MNKDDTKQAIIGFMELMKGITGNKDLKIPEDVAKEYGIEQEPFMNKPCVAHQVCHEDKVKALDRIRAEIQATIDEERTGNGNINKGVVIGLQMSLDTIDKYKAESEVTDADGD